MTVCVAAFCYEPQMLIAVSDRMVSMSGYFSADNMADKAFPLRPWWMGMMAGDDISCAAPILDEIKKSPQSSDSTRDMVGICTRAFLNEKIASQERGILARYGFYSMAKFHAEGSSALTDIVFSQVIDELRRHSLLLDLLIAGYDSEMQAHLFTLSDPVTCSHYDSMGFWAIGSGQHSALGSLFASRYSRFESLPVCVYKCLAAKFAAETAVGVGKTTFVVLASPQPSEALILTEDIIESSRQAWDALPRIPGSSTIEEISSGITLAKQMRERVLAKKKQTTEGH